MELEKAQPSFDVVVRMARALGVSLDTLAKEEDAPPPPKRATRQAAGGLGGAVEPQEVDEIIKHQERASMPWRPWRWCAVALVVVLLGCSSDNATPPLTGTWTGPLQDSLAGRGTLVLTISQTNRQLTGTWQSTFPDTRNNNSGTLAGTGPARDLLITMVWSTAQPGACSFTVTAMLDPNDDDHFTGTYVPVTCGRPESGSLDVTRR